MPMFVMSLASTEGTKQSLSFQSHEQNLSLSLPSFKVGNELQVGLSSKAKRGPFT